MATDRPNFVFFLVDDLGWADVGVFGTKVYETPNALTNRVQASEVYGDTSTFRTVDMDRLITSEDRAFRPVDLEVGPDGCLCVADWYDVRLTNLNPHDTWDKSTGRIYQITPANFVRPPNPDLRNASPAELINLLSHANRWHREHARRLLANRPEKIESELTTMLKRDDDAALEALWVLNLRGELDTVLLRRALRHPNEHVRRWGVRLIGDGGEAGGILAAELAILARHEQAMEVRSQLASTAKRLPAREAFPIIRGLLDREEDLHDKHIPMLIWWAIEAHADKGRNELLDMLQDRSVWRTGIFSEYIVSRIGKRYTADQGSKKYYTLTEGVYSDWRIERSDEYLRRNLKTAAQILALAPDSQASMIWWSAWQEVSPGREWQVSPKSFPRNRTSLGHPSAQRLACHIGRSAPSVWRIASRPIPDEERQAWTNGSPTARGPCC